MLPQRFVAIEDVLQLPSQNTLALGAFLLFNAFA